MAKMTLVEIKRSLEAHVGAKIRLRANGGRRKAIEKTGVLIETYPSLFIVSLDEERAIAKRVSYSYADILTSSVEVLVDSEDGFVEIAASHA